MRRISVVVAVAVVAVAVLVGVGLTRGAAARDDRATVSAPHPMVGSWREGRNGGSFISFFADGIVIQAFAGGPTWHGVWQPVDDPNMIATYLVESRLALAGRGMQSFAVDIKGDELTLGDGTFERMVAPSPGSFDRIGTPTG